MALIVDNDFLMEHGWVLLNTTLKSESTIQAQLISLAEKLGTPMPSRLGQNVCDRLRPIENSNAFPKSLSRLYGKGEFPLHTDTAHWTEPCRYVLIACVLPGSAKRKTVILDSKKILLKDTQKNKLMTIPFRIVNGKTSFFGKVLDYDQKYIRFDPGCMKAIDENGERVINWFLRQKKFAREINWVPGMILIIDNWRVLHGRSLGNDEDDNRLLMRVLVR